MYSTEFTESIIYQEYFFVIDGIRMWKITKL